MSCLGKAFIATFVSVFSPLNAAWALQAAPASEPATAPAAGVDAAPSELLRLYVAEVKGIVQVREASDKPWQVAKVGMDIGPGADVRTGTHAHVILVIPPNQILKLDRLGTMSVLEAVKQGKKVTTDFAMKYGRTDYEIQAAGQEHDAKIRTPGATLSVRGTRFITTDQPPFAPEAYTYHGVVDYQYAQRLMKVGQSGRVVGGNNSADTSLLSNSVDPSIANARPAGEAIAIANEQSRGAILQYNPITQIQTVRDTRGPQTNQELIDSLPGRLNLVARWSEDTNINLAIIHQAGNPLDLSVSLKQSDFLYPGFRQNTNASGGHIAVDDRGGPNGGQETAYFNGNNLDGVYGLLAFNLGSNPASVRFNAFFDGNPLTLFSVKLGSDGEPVLNEDGLPTLEKATTITRDVPAGGNAVATATNPAKFQPVDDPTPGAVQSATTASASRKKTKSMDAVQKKNSSSIPTASFRSSAVLHK